MQLIDRTLTPQEVGGWVAPHQEGSSIGQHTFSEPLIMTATSSSVGASLTYGYIVHVAVSLAFYENENMPMFFNESRVKTHFGFLYTQTP